MRRPVQEHLVDQMLALLAARQHRMEGAEVRLPRRSYVCPERFEAEERAVLRRRPIVVGASAELRAPGDWIATRIGRTPIVVVRDAGGQLAALVNRCRHRGASLVTERCGADLRAFVCPFHAWTYDLSGRLTHIPLQEGFPSSERERPGLHRLAVAERAGLVWVVLEGPMPNDWMTEPIRDDLESFGLEHHHVLNRTERVVKANWKMVVDAFLENYHAKMLHRPSVAGMHLEHGTHVDPFPPDCRSVWPRRPVRHATTVPRSAWDIRRYATTVYHLYPATLVVVHPDWISVVGMLGRSVGETLFRHTMLAAEPPGDPVLRAHLDRSFAFIDREVLAAEDLAMAEQLFAEYEAAPDGDVRLGRQEFVMARFHEQVERDVAGEPSLEPSTVVPPQAGWCTDLDVLPQHMNEAEHVGIDALMALLQQARMRLVGEIGYPDGDIHGQIPVVTHLEASFHAEAFVGDVLRVQIGFSAWSGGTVEAEHTVIRTRDDRKIAVVRAKLVFIDRARRTPTSVPAEFRARAERIAGRS